MCKNQNIPSLFLITFYALVLLPACKSNKEDARTDNRLSELRAEVYVVQPQTFREDISASGTLRPNEEVIILPEVSGRITAIQFEEGTNVKKGTQLVQLNDADILAQIKKLRALKSLQEKMLERQEELLRIGGISRQDYETTQTEIASIDADIAFQEAQLRKTKIIAPFDGRIGIRNVSVGAIVSPVTVIASLLQLHPLKMDFTIPDQYHAVARVGKTVFFRIDGHSEPRSGKISAVDPGADINTRSVKVRAIVPNTDGKLTAGSFAHVQIPNESDNNAILVPSQAVIPTTREKKVAIIREGKAQLVTVNTGARTEDNVQILSGLVPGDTVITTGIMQVKAGMNVTVTKVRD